MTVHLLPSTPPTALDRWNNGAPDQTVMVGDLWVVGYDGDDLGLVLIAAVRGSHVVVWPVTDETVTPGEPCVALAADWLTIALVAWPEAEAGVSFASLDRKLGHVLQPRIMLAVYQWVRGDEQPDNVTTYETREDGAFLDALDKVCQFAGDLSDLDWPSPDEHVGVLNPDLPVEATVLREAVKAATGTTTPAVVMNVVEGRRLLTETEAVSLAERLNTPLADVLIPPSGGVVLELRHPSRKRRIRSIAAQRNVTENDIRTSAWSKTQAAARQTGARSDDADAARVDQALAELAQGN